VGAESVGAHLSKKTQHDLELSLLEFGPNAIHLLSGESSRFRVLCLLWRRPLLWRLRWALAEYPFPDEASNFHFGQRWQNQVLRKRAISFGNILAQCLVVTRLTVAVS
jgi:hypothetical protein